MKEWDDRKPLIGSIKLDDEYRGGKRGRSAENNTHFLAAVALNSDHHLIPMNLNVVKGFRASEIKRWAGKHLEPGSLSIRMV